MLKDVIIDINSISGCDEDQSDNIEFSTEGYYGFEDDVACITYQETEVTGMEGTRTSVFVMPDKIVVDRDGNVTSRMVFQQGEKNQFIYNTPYGKAVLGIDTKSIKHSFDLNGGNAEIDYVINVEHTIFTKNRFKISVRNSGVATNA